MLSSLSSSSIVRAGLVQHHHPIHGDEPCETHYHHSIQAHEGYLEQASNAGVHIVCFQELFTGPYFAPSQDSKWFNLTERLPEGRTVQWGKAMAKQYQMVLILPVFEEAKAPGFYYNTAVVIDSDGTYLGKYRKHHIPQVAGFWEKYFFKPGSEGFPVFETAVGTVGLFICYDRHFPECARALALHGATMAFNPSATVAGLSESLWKKEQVAQAIANGMYIGAVNRVGQEQPWNIGHFYGSSYVVNPWGDIIAEGSREESQLVVADMDMNVVREARQQWQFFRDRRPESYQPLLLS
ncbi:MAG: nitrilase-related carbon-nitrogen hydrolase [Vampirovibrionales bacterium]